MVYFIMVVMALKMYITAIPHRIIMVGVTFLNAAMKITTAVGTSANRNAFTIWPSRSLRNGTTLNPKMTLITIPNSAPDDIPRV